MNPLIQLYLASTSPRRQALLTQVGYLFKTLAIQIDETPQANEKATDFVTRMALEKARAGWQHVQRTNLLPVLAADTIVVLDDEIFGKPRDRHHALSMLEQLSARSHQVMTAIAVRNREYESVRLTSSQVSFRQLSRLEIESYWQTGEPEGKAGGYAIQGRAALFIKHLEGSYSSVMGLPLCETGELLAQSGVIAMTGSE